MIEFVYHPDFGYTVYAFGTVICECLSKKELDSLTIGEILDSYNAWIGFELDV